jgi:SAM-dependent methyltransferase
MPEDGHLAPASESARFAMGRKLVVGGYRAVVGSALPTHGYVILSSGGKDPYAMATEFDEQWYLKRYPDVAKAIAAGSVRSALAHYQAHGIKEKRQPAPDQAGGPAMSPRRSYQSFDDKEGNSLSELKYQRLRYNAFNGKTVLDIGCNEGFFSLTAAKAGATRVVGLDQNKDIINAARDRYAQSGLAQDIIDFRCQSWDQLPEEEFDVILLLSALHYAEDQSALIKSLMDKLTPSGVLVLECGVINNDRVEFVTVDRAIDKRQFPTTGKLKEMFGAYAWKQVGSSVDQSGDPIPRKVFHIRRLKPTVMLLLGAAYSGKTTLARRLRTLGIPCVMIDAYVGTRLREAGADWDPRLAAVIAEYHDPERLARLYGKIREKGMIDLLFDDIIKSLDQYDAPVLLVEGAIGEDAATQKIIVNKFEDKGYFVWLCKSGA